MKQSKRPTPTQGGAYVRRQRAADGRPAKPSPDGSSAVERRAPSYDGPTKGDDSPFRAQEGEGAQGVKPAVGALGRTAEHRTHKQPTARQRPDQVPPRRRGESGGGSGGGQGGEQYVRLRVRVRGDQLSVIDSHLVDGPLGQVTAFPGTNAYDVTVNGRLLHAGALPDLGLQRSFVNPDGPAEQQGHHVRERETYEFMARVPAAELTLESLRDVRVTLHRVKEEAASPRLGTEALGRQFERQLRPVAELVGLPESVLPAAIEERGGRTPTV